MVCFFAWGFNSPTGSTESFFFDYRNKFTFLHFTFISTLFSMYKPAGMTNGSVYSHLVSFKVNLTSDAYELMNYLEQFLKKKRAYE